MISSVLGGFAFGIVFVIVADTWVADWLFHYASEHPYSRLVRGFLGGNWR